MPKADTPEVAGLLREYAQRDDFVVANLIRPYYLRPDGKVSHDAFAVVAS